MPELTIVYIIAFLLLSLFVILFLFAFRFENRLRKIYPDRKKEFFLSVFAPYNFLRYFKKLDYFQTDDKVLKELKKNVAIVECVILIVFAIFAIFCTIH